MGQSQVQSPAQVKDPRESNFQGFQASCCAPQKAGGSGWNSVYRSVETIVGSTRDALKTNLWILHTAGSCVGFLSLLKRRLVFSKYVTQDLEGLAS